MVAVSFSWEGALVAFLTFNAVKGVDIMMNAYLAFYEDRVSTPGGDAKTDGKAHILSYAIQIVTITCGGGCVARKGAQSYFGTSLKQPTHRH